MHSAIRAEPDPVGLHPRRRLFRLLNAHPQLGPQRGRRHRQQVEAGIARRHMQVAPGRPHGEDHLPLPVDQHRRRRMASQNRPLAYFGQAGLGGCGPLPVRFRQPGRRLANAEGKARLARAAAQRMPVEPLALGNGFKPPLGLAHRLR